MLIKEILKKFDEDDVLISERIKNKIFDRGLGVEEVKKKLFDVSNLEVESKKNGSYFLIYSLSGKYRMVIAAYVNDKIRIATAFKTSKKIDELLKRAKSVIRYVKKIPP